MQSRGLRRVWVIVAVALLALPACSDGGSTPAKSDTPSPPASNDEELTSAGRDTVLNCDVGEDSPVSPTTLDPTVLLGCLAVVEEVEVIFADELVHTVIYRIDRSIASEGVVPVLEAVTGETYDPYSHFTFEFFPPDSGDRIGSEGFVAEQEERLDAAYANAIFDYRAGLVTADLSLDYFADAESLGVTARSHFTRTDGFGVSIPSIGNLVAAEVDGTVIHVRSRPIGVVRVSTADGAMSSVLTYTESPDEARGVSEGASVEYSLHDAIEQFGLDSADPGQFAGLFIVESTIDLEVSADSELAMATVEAAAKADATTLGREIATYWVGGTGPLDIVSDGRHYSLVADGSTEQIAEVSDGVSLGGFREAGVRDWCVWVEAPLSESRAYRYSFAGGLEAGKTCE